MLALRSGFATMGWWWCRFGSFFGGSQLLGCGLRVVSSELFFFNSFFVLFFLFILSILIFFLIYHSRRGGVV
jgi:hypothetical protein